MADNPVLTKTHMTAAEYMTLPEMTQPMQLIEGEIVLSPAPKHTHQKVILSSVRVLDKLIPDGELVIAPSDLHLDDKTFHSQICSG